MYAMIIIRNTELREWHVVDISTFFPNGVIGLFVLIIIPMQ